MQNRFSRFPHDDVMNLSWILHKSWSKVKDETQTPTITQI